MATNAALDSARKRDNRSGLCAPLLRNISRCYILKYGTTREKKAQEGGWGRNAPHLPPVTCPWLKANAGLLCRAASPSLSCCCGAGPAGGAVPGQNAVLSAGAGPVAGLRHLRDVPAPACADSVQPAGGAQGGRVCAAQLVGGVRAPVLRRRSQHLLHCHRVGPAVPGGGEASGSAAAVLGGHCAQPQVRLRDSSVPEAAGAVPGALVRSHRLSRLHPAAASHDPSLPGQLRGTEQSRVTLCEPLFIM